jgi:hypothetical protein
VADMMFNMRLIKKGNSFKFDCAINTDGTKASFQYSKSSSNSISTYHDKEIPYLKYSPADVETEFLAADPGARNLLEISNGDSKDSTRLTFSAEDRANFIKTKRFNQVRNNISKISSISSEDIVNGYSYIGTLKHYSRMLTTVEEAADYQQYLESTVVTFESILMICPPVDSLNSIHLDLVKYANESTFSPFEVDEILRIISNFFSLVTKSITSNAVLSKLSLSSSRLKACYLDHVVRTIKETDPTITDFVCGDWSREDGFKNVAPTLGRSILYALQKAGFNVYILREGYTSIRCCKCKDIRSECRKFVVKKNKKYSKKKVSSYEQLIHGLLKCNLCGTIFKRDVNGVNNIYYKAKAIRQGTNVYYYLQEYYE